MSEYDPMGDDCGDFDAYTHDEMDCDCADIEAYDAAEALALGEEGEYDADIERDNDEGWPHNSVDMSDDADALASAGHGNDEDYNHYDYGDDGDF